MDSTGAESTVTAGVAGTAGFNGVAGVAAITDASGTWTPFET